MRIRSLLFPLAPFFLGAPAMAQTMVTVEDLFTVGSMYRVAVQKSPEVTPGDNGTDQEWHFPDLQVQALRTVEVRASELGGMAGGWTGDRVVIDMDAGSTYHLSLESGAVLLHGQVSHAEAGPQVLKLDPPLVLLNLPARYFQFRPGRSQATVMPLADQSAEQVAGSDTPRSVHDIAQVSEVGGAGLITTPMGTFPAVKHTLRIKLTRWADTGRTDQDPQGAGEQRITTRMTIWCWWSPQFGLPVLVLVDEDDDGSVDRAEWMVADLGATRATDRPAQMQVAVFPFPRIDRVVVAPVHEGGATYTIADASGRIVRQGHLTHEDLGIAVWDLDRGAYLLRMEQDREVVHARLLVH